MNAAKHPTGQVSQPRITWPHVNSVPLEKACVIGTEPLRLLVIGGIFRDLVWESFLPTWASLQGPGLNVLIYKMGIIISDHLHNWLRSANQSKDKKLLEVD